MAHTGRLSHHWQQKPITETTQPLTKSHLLPLNLFVQAMGAAAGEEEEQSKMEPEQDDRRNHKNQTLIDHLSLQIINGDLQTKIQAARDIRNLVRKSSSPKARTKFAASGVLQPLVLMLYSPNHDARQSSLLALLNLAARNERNKVRIVGCGSIPPLVELLKLQNNNDNLRDLATAAIMTLSAAPPNKPTITTSGSVPLLVQVLSSGSVQGRVDALTALYNLSSDPNLILDAKAVSPLINLLKECKKYSKCADKTTSLLEILSKSETGRIAITDTNNGILTLVETIEDGSLHSTEHAVGALLSLCMSSRSKYRQLILNEGAIPGLLRLTAEGTPEAQDRARKLLDLLRKSPPEKKLTSSALEKIAYEIAARVDGKDKTAETAKRLLQDMVQRSMELGTRIIQHRTASRKPSEVVP